MKKKKLIGNRIKELRKGKKFSQEKLAEMAEINAKYLSRIELGKENPTLDMMIKLADTLEIEMHEMFDFGHTISDKELRSAVCNLAKKTRPEKLRLAFRLLKLATE